MSFCTKCGKELIEGAAFCPVCGAAVEAAAKMEQAQAEQVLESQVYPADPISAMDSEAQYAEEKECLDTYYKLLKWERISWSISSKVLLVMTFVFAAYMLLFVMMGISFEDPVMTVMGICYALLFPGMYVAFHIVCKMMVGKVQNYMDTLYTDIRPTVTRCESIGMIVFCYFFNTIAMVFYIINFARTKGSKDVIARIIAHQQEGR